MKNKKSKTVTSSSSKKKASSSEAEPRSKSGKQGKKVYTVTSSIAVPGMPPIAQQTPAIRLGNLSKSKKNRKKS